MKPARSALRALRIVRLVEILLRAAGLLLLLSLAVAAPLLALPPRVAAAVLLLGTGSGLEWLRRRPRWWPALLLRRPSLRESGWLAVAALVTAALAPSLAVVNHRIWGTRPEAPDPLQAPYGEPGGQLALLLSAVLLAPLGEELVVRGYLLGRLRAQVGPARALVLSAAAFAVFHVAPWRMPYYFVMGLLFGGAVLALRSVWAGVALHVAYNASLLALAERFPTREALARGMESRLGDLYPLGSLGVGFLLLALLALQVRPAESTP